MPGLYQRLLRLADDVAAPDYYQLLDVERGMIDATQIDDAFKRRSMYLDAPGEGYTEVAEYFRRELVEAKETLLDPGRREQYDGILKQRRMEDVRRCVGHMLDSGCLPQVTAQALVAWAASVGVDADDTNKAIDEGLRKLGADRASGAEADDAAVAEKKAEIVKLISDMAESQLMGQLTLAGIGIQAPPTEKLPAIRPVEVPRPAQRGTARRVAPAPVPVPAPVQEVPVVTKPRGNTARRVQTGAVDTEVAVPSGDSSALNAKIHALEKERGALQQQVGAREPERRSSRRRMRCMVALFLVALAYIGGHVLGMFKPAVTEKVASLAAAPWEKLVASVGAPAKAAGVCGGAAVLVYLVVMWIAGARSRVWFLLPSALLCAASFGLGLMPLGNYRELRDMQRQMQETMQQNQGKEQSLTAYIEQLKTDNATVVAKRDGEIKELSQQLGARTEELKAATTERDLIRGQVEEVMKFKKQVQERDARILELEKSVKELQDAKAAAEAEVQALKRKLEEKK